MVAIFVVVTFHQIVEPEFSLVWKLVMISGSRSQLKCTGGKIGFKGFDTAIMRNNVEIRHFKALRLCPNSGNVVRPSYFEQCTPRQCPMKSSMRLTLLNLDARMHGPMEAI